MRFIIGSAGMLIFFVMYLLIILWLLAHLAFRFLFSLASIIRKAAIKITSPFRPKSVSKHRHVDAPENHESSKASVEHVHYPE